MTRIAVNAQEVTAIGVGLVGAAERLAALPDDAGGGSRAVGGGAAGAALEELMTGWRHERMRLGRSLTDLGDAAKSAGACYVEVEMANERRLGGGRG